VMGMRLDAVVAATAFALAVSTLLSVYAQGLKTAYVGRAKCWIKAEEVADEVAAGRVPADGHVVIRLISRDGVVERVVGLGRGASCYTFRLLENGTLLYVEVIGG